jgi:hypothetical protein
MTDTPRIHDPRQVQGGVQGFLERARAARQSRPRLVMGVDATASRQPTWDRASELQAKMFEAAGNNIEVQLVYFRGAADVRECRASGWLSGSKALASAMAKITCQGGTTQIERVLDHTLREAEKRPIRALVYIGDCCEEARDTLLRLATMLGEKSIPIFAFQEGDDQHAASVFKGMTERSNGIFAQFDERSAQRLTELLKVVGEFAVSNDHAALDHARTKLMLGYNKGR